LVDDGLVVILGNCRNEGFRTPRMGAVSKSRTMMNQGLIEPLLLSDCGQTFEVVCWGREEE